MASPPKDSLRIVIVGHVDHGKSTLIGRLLFETGSLPDGKYEAVQEMSKKRGMAFEWAFLLDALQAERDQGITIDTTQIPFRTDKRDYTLIDAPGHVEFLKNMITGAAQADAAFLVIDVEEGVSAQTRQHTLLLQLMGMKSLAVVINKMDRVSYDEKRFRKIKDDIESYLQEINLSPSAVIPISAREGVNIAPRAGANIAKSGKEMAWHKKPNFLEVLDSFPLPISDKDKPLRLPIQDIYKFDERRIFAGRVESGVIKKGETLLFSPSNKSAKVARIESWPSQNGGSAEAGESVGITLDAPIFIERGEIASHMEKAPFLTDIFSARIFWLGKHPLKPSTELKMKLATTETEIIIRSIDRSVDAFSLEELSPDALQANQIADITLQAPSFLALDSFLENPKMGRFVLMDGYDIAGGGVLSLENYRDQRKFQKKVESRTADITPVEHRITTGQRETRNHHKGGVLWMTGLSGSGKSTLAFSLEKYLFDQGYLAYVLDGDNIRYGLNSDLGFAPQDRTENIRRIGEVASLFSHTGFIVISAFISPYRSDRKMARGVSDNFHEIYIKADLETCEKRDPKGLYKRARAGQIANFTGISAPYEEPESPELILETKEDVESCLKILIDYVEKQFPLTQKKRHDYKI